MQLNTNLALNNTRIFFKGHRHKSFFEPSVAQGTKKRLPFWPAFGLLSDFSLTPLTKFIPFFLSHSAPRVLQFASAPFLGGNQLSAILLSSEGSLPKTCPIHSHLRAHFIMLLADGIPACLWISIKPTILGMMPPLTYENEAF